MNTKARFVLILTLALLGGAALVLMSQAAPGAAPLAQGGDLRLAQGGAPAVVAYQGEVRVSDAPYTGTGYFKFAVVNAAGDTAYWSNDGTSTGGGEPTAAVGLTVSDGLFSVLLEDTTLGGMTQALTADVFGQPDRNLRVWFSTSGGGPFDQLTPDTRIAAVPYALQAQEASDADTVDGLHASELGADYQNVVIVAQSGGDYTSVQAAIDSITGAAADNPYLVWVAPGVYSETVTMKPYVHLQGAGQETTVITSTASSSAFPPTQATLVMTIAISLRDLTVGNSGAGERNTALLATDGTTRTLVADVTVRAQGVGTYNIAIFQSGSGTSVTLQRVTALAENGDRNYGLLNYDGAAATLHGGAFTGRAGTHARGIQLSGSGTILVAESVTVLAENGSYDNYGLYNHNDAAATLRGGDYTARGGNDAWGIYNAGSGTTLETESVTALAEDGNYNYSLVNEAGAAATVHGGSFVGSGGWTSYGINNTGSGTMLVAESITALAENGANWSTALNNENSASAKLYGAFFTGRGGLYARGIWNGSSGTLDANNVTALAEDGSNNSWGLLNYGGVTTGNSSQFIGSSNGLYLEGGAVSLGVSQLDGGADLVSGTLTCFQVYDENYAAYTCP